MFMQRLYCDGSKVEWDNINENDSEIVIYGDEDYDILIKDFVVKLALRLKDLTSVSLENIRVIEARAFENIWTGNFKLTLPDTLEYIKECAFLNCTVTGTVIIPSSVTSIERCAFYGCPMINSIYFEEDSKISIIPDKFCYSSSIANVGIKYKSGNITNPWVVEFPKSVTFIGSCAFEECSLLGNSLNISDNVTTIGNYAFKGTAIGNINLGKGLVTGRSYEYTNEEFKDSGYATTRTVNPPYSLYLSSKRQFRYKHIDIEEDTEARTIIRLTETDDFKFCLEDNHMLAFRNGLLLPPTYYHLHPIINTPIDEAAIVINVALEAGDYLDIFYVTNAMKHMEVDYYDTLTKERYLKNGMVLLNSHDNEYRVMGEQLYEGDDRRTNYIKLRSPLYAISSKHSTFVFLNGKKVRLDELEDISDTIMSINTDYSDVPDEMNAVRLEVMNHLDTQDIIEQLYINDGLSHDDETVKNAFTVTGKKVEQNTRLIKSFSLKALEAYAERTLLDKVLNDLSDENLNKLFYNYTDSTGPMTHYLPDKMNDPDFVNKDEIVDVVIDEYYYSSDPKDYVWDTFHNNNGHSEEQNNTFYNHGTGDYFDDRNESNTVFYIGDKDKIRVPTVWDDETLKAIYGTTFNRNTFLKKVIIPEGTETIE